MSAIGLALGRAVDDDVDTSPSYQPVQAALAR